MELARHGAHTFEGLLTRTVAVLAAHTCPSEAHRLDGQHQVIAESLHRLAAVAEAAS